MKAKSAIAFFTRTIEKLDAIVRKLDLSEVPHASRLIRVVGDLQDISSQWSLCSKKKLDKQLTGDSVMDFVPTPVHISKNEIVRFLWENATEAIKNAVGTGAIEFGTDDRKIFNRLIGEGYEIISPPQKEAIISMNLANKTDPQQLVEEVDPFQLYGVKLDGTGMYIDPWGMNYPKFTSFVLKRVPRGEKGQALSTWVQFFEDRGEDLMTAEVGVSQQPPVLVAEGMFHDRKFPDLILQGPTSETKFHLRFGTPLSLQDILKALAARATEVTSEGPKGELVTVIQRSEEKRPENPESIIM